MIVQEQAVVQRQAASSLYRQSELVGGGKSPCTQDREISLQAEQYGRARRSALAAVQRRGQAFEGHDQGHGRQHRHAASRHRSRVDTA